jgi:hypothetical protein
MAFYVDDGWLMMVRWRRGCWCDGQVITSNPNDKCAKSSLDVTNGMGVVSTNKK